jgi:hypothetical protein
MRIGASQAEPGTIDKSGGEAAQEQRMSKIGLIVTAAAFLILAVVGYFITR